MLPQLFSFLLLGVSVFAQDETASPVPAETPTDTWSAPPTHETGGAWNETHFIAPTRQHYWVNDADNGARWEPLNVPVNLFLSNSNPSVLADRQLLAGNIPPGTSTWTGKVSVPSPAANYLLSLTETGNIDRKLAQTQGFWIKQNGTLQVQPVTPDAPATPAPAPDAGSDPAPTSAAEPATTSPVSNGETQSDGAMNDPADATPPGSSASTVAPVMAGVLGMAVAAALF